MIYHPEIHGKIWGEEEWIVNTDSYCGKRLCLRRKFRCSLHYHAIKDETFYVQVGKLWMEVDGQGFLMKPGDAIHIKPYQIHRFTGLTDCEVMEFSTRHAEVDSYRETQSCEVPDAEFNELLKKLQ